MLTYDTVTEPLMRDAQSQKATNTNTLNNNARTKRHEPYNTVNQKIYKQPKHTMPDIQFHDPDEQHWLALGSKNLEMGRILLIKRDAYAVPSGPNVQIYHERRGIAYLVD